MPLFTPDERERLRGMLVAAARTDPRVAGAAHLGSFALDRVDRWSDIDLGLGLAGEANLAEVVADWTGRMYAEHRAVTHLDVRRGTVLYRVFLLGSSLQVDLSFWPAGELGATGPAFRLVLGTAWERPPAPAPEAAHHIGLAWVYALHVRSSLARGRVWQAEHLLGTVRGHVLALACLRHDLPAGEGRGLDDLPPGALISLAGALPRSLDPSELGRAFGVTTRALLTEIREADPDLAERLAGPLGTLVG